MSELVACIEGVGVLGPGLSDWRAAAAVLDGTRPYAAARTVLPLPAALSATERRRAGRLVRLALTVGAEAVRQSGRDAHSLPSVFSASSGDGDTLLAICETLSGSERLISPTRFHNSVHNAASGYWSIAQDCMEASTALCAHDASFGAGLLEALAQVAQAQRPVLLVAYDAEYPPPLYAKRPIPDAFGVALVLGPAPPGAAVTGTGIATLRVRLSVEPADRMSDPLLEAMRGSIPAARALPLLARLARTAGAEADAGAASTGSAASGDSGRTGHVVLDYLDTARLAVEVDP
jgi:hypothetical protein